jgi:ELWxxDGT repeat protein
MNRKTQADVGSRPVAARRRRRSRAVDVGGLQLLEPRIAFAVAPVLVADINALAASALDGEILGSGPTPATSQFVTVNFPSPTNALTVYAADDGVIGRELWVSDGTPAGTRLLQDINLTTASAGGPGGSDPADFFIAGSTLYFSADDGVHGRELWKTDGTSSGTVLVKDLVPGGGAGDPREHAILPSGEVLFVAQSGLWKTDGTEAGTVAIDPTNTLNLDFERTSFTRVSGLTRLGGRVLFAGGVLGGGFGTTELWSTDGTLANTAPLRQSDGAPVDGPRDFTVVTETITFPGVGTLPDFTQTNDLAFFSAAGRLWRLVEGTSTVPELVSPIAPFGALVAFGGFTSGTGTSEPTRSGSRLVFAGDDGTTGVELWTIDGSSAATNPTQIADINQTTSGSFQNGSAPTDFRVAGTNLFFSADDGVNGREFWTYDGSTAAMLRDIRPGSAGCEPVLLAASGSTLYFSADDGVNGRELWTSAGTAATTALVKDINAGSKSAFSQDSSATYLSAAVLGGELLFAADDGQHGVELWKSDGTPGGTVLLEDINTKTADGLDGFSSGSGAALSAALFDGAVYFPADDGIHGTELWKRVGDAAPQLVKDLNSDTATFNGGGPEFVTAGNLLFYTWPRQEPGSFGSITVTDLWRTDGTEAGTILLRQNITGGSAGLAELGGKVVFSATDTGGRELWISDGTVAGTTPLKDIAIGGDGSPQDFFSFGSLVLFTADDGTTGRELWKTDGTETGTVRLADIDPTTSSGPASGIEYDPQFTLFGGQVYFVANDGTRGVELWRTDGMTASLAIDINTTTTTDPLNPLLTFPGSSSPYALTSFGSVLLFGANDGVNGKSLWKTDGTAVGTSLVRNVAPFSSNANGPFTIAGGKAFFGATDGTRDRLWQTDGTTAGTTSIPDVDPAYVTRDIGNVLAVGNDVFFSADRRFVDPTKPAGRALFRSDGTVAGTSLVELSPGVSGAQQFPILATADRLYFGADDLVRGLELWQLPFDTIPPTVMITVDRSSLGIGQTAAVTFTLSELPAGFAAGAVTVTGGTLTNFAGAGTAYTATFVPQASFTGTATIQVAAGVFTDAAGNPNAASPVTTIAIDTRPPTVIVTLGAQSLGIGETAAVTFTLDKPSTTFTVADVGVTGGTLTNFAGAGTAYTATFVPEANFTGTATIQVAAGVFTDAAGNPNAGIPALPIQVDTRPRGALAAGTDGNPLAGSREFAYTASGPTTIRIAGLSAVQAGFFSPRMRLTLTPTDATASSAATVLRRSYDARSRTVTVTLDRAIPQSPAAGTLVLGEASAPAARLIDAATGEVRREIGGAALAAAGYSPAFVTRFQGGLRVGAGDIDGDSFPDLAAAPGATPLRSPTTDFGRSTRLVSLFSGAATPAWPAVTVDVSAVFPDSAAEGFFVALGNVVADGEGGGTRELVVASGRRVAVFDVLVSAGIPSIVPTPLRVIDLPGPGRITSVATGSLFDPSGLEDIVVAATTGTQRVAGTTTVTVLGGGQLQILRSFRASSLVESGPARRLVDVFGRGASLAVGDIDGDGRRDLVLGAGSNGLGNFRVLGNEFVTASSATTNVGGFTAAIADELGNSVRFGHRRAVGKKWKPTGGPDFFTPGDVVGPTGSGFNAPLAVATVSGDSGTGGKARIFAALGATNQTGNEIRRLLSAGPGSWASDAAFRQLPATQASGSAGSFRSGTGLRLG